MSCHPRSRNLISSSILRNMKATALAKRQSEQQS
jgi:hypothetical protein